MSKWVYSFGKNHSDGDARMKMLLGGKGANLAEMAQLGLPVPPGFTISTAVCTYYYAHQKSYPESLARDVAAALAQIETEVGKGFGDVKSPLLVSVRSGAPASMPGMMDTVLNLGLNDKTVNGLAELTQDARFAYDSYRRFIQMYGDVVLEIDHNLFEEAMEDIKQQAGLEVDTELSAEQLKELVTRYKAIVEQETGRPFPQDPQEQLWGAISAVFGSWMNQRAVTYRRLHDIPADWGTAVNVQAMVFGNMGEDCATGVAFTRNPATGENEFYGEYLINAQGEDVVAGIRTPQPLTRAGAEHDPDATSMEEAMPNAFKELKAIRHRLEKHYADMQDIEFTIQQERLYILQTRSGKRTTKAALRIAVEMCREGMIDQSTAVMRIAPASLDQLLHPTLDPKAEKHILARGLPASPGAAYGQIVLHADDAERLAERGMPVILVREETSPEDIHGMHAAKGILTTRGGMTSHAAVVARGMGRPCVSGAASVRINIREEIVQFGDVTLKAGDMITLDGKTGKVILGKVPTIEPELSGDFAQIMEWADQYRRLELRANAETIEDAKTAIRFGAEGIGLCRTEHMFFDNERIVAMRRMIVASEREERERALADLLPMQKQDFKDLFRIMGERPVTIRLLDPPLHEFLPQNDAEIAEVAKAAKADIVTIQHIARNLHESNPMLGHRGCRLGISYPEIYRMQARAIFEAVAELLTEGHATIIPEIMIPLALSRTELDILKQDVDAIGVEISDKYQVTMRWLVGTMIELPRAALRAGELAESAAFFSFGTNDLTQTTCGISRDDAGSFLGIYQEKGIFSHDPFASLDQEGVGELIQIACERGRKTRPDLKLGVCGEHGGDPKSIGFFEQIGLDYVSCSPYRVAVARLAAAQAALKRQKSV